MPRLAPKLLPLHLTQAWRQFAISLLSLFSTIYVYKTLGSLSFVFLFWLFFHLAKLIANFLAEDFSRRSGLGEQVRLGMILLFLGSLFLLFSRSDANWILPGGILWGASAGFYWFGWHGLMAKTATNGHFGYALGQREIISLIPLLLSPILGGLLINFFGYPALFITALGFVALSLFSLRMVSFKKTHYDTSPREILSLFRTHKRMFLAYFGDSGSGYIYYMFFPLYLFLILGKELSLGGFYSLALMMVAILSFLIGRAVDIKGKKELIGFGAIFSFFIWLGRLLSRMVGFLFFLDVSERVVEKMTSIPLEVFTYEKALDGHATGRAVLFREMAIELGAIFVCLVMLVLQNLRISFVLAAVLTLLPLLLLRKSGLYGERLKK